MSNASELPERAITGTDKRGKHDRSMMKKNGHGLNLRQQLFVAYYLEQGCNNAYQAAIRAGYSESNARLASVNVLELPQVKASLARRLGQKFKKADINADRVLEEIGRMAFSNVLDFTTINEDGTFDVNLAKLDRDTASAIAELYYDSNGKPRVKLADKRASLELLGRFLKLFGSDQPKGTGTGEHGEPLTVQSLDHIIQSVTVYNQQQITINHGQSLPAQPDAKQLEAGTDSMPSVEESQVIEAQL